MGCVTAPQYTSVYKGGTICQKRQQKIPKEQDARR